MVTLQPIQSVSKPDLVSLEKNIGFELPSDYKFFLNESNGGLLKNRIFNVPDLEQDVLMDVFFAVGATDEELDLAFLYNEYSDEMPEGSLIIGSDPGGNFLLLITEGEDAGVYYWDHTHFFPSSDEEGNTYFVAESFTEFINDLKPLE